MYVVGLFEKRRIGRVLVISAMWILVSASLALSSVSADWVEEWAGGSVEGWLRRDTVNGRKMAPDMPGEYIAMVFGAQFLSFPEVDMLYADSAASGGKFVGDYVAGGITAVSFQFLCEQITPGQARVYFEATSGRRWYYDISGLEAGEWVGCHVPFSYVSGWQTGTDPTEEKFQEDMQSVVWIGVRVMRGGGANETYGLDDFALESVTPEDGGVLPEWWVAEYFGSVTKDGGAVLAGADSDGDGMSNYSEYRAGTDPNNLGSLLQVGIAPENVMNDVGIVVTWDSVAERSYSVLRATSLIDGFSVMETAIGATPPLNEYRDITATNDGPYFYKIRVE